ncbi:rifin [Plasmodium reichenowi]|uniref:Rifin n=1 Tax=Plasmodium reichenowi TaxID=5854 RepID=A0A060RME5_PLARE|nr:rifin [Plasmodium reichenowi]
MKVHYINILLFVIPLNILVHNKNKPYITPHHTQTNRSLCECNTQSTIYDNDAEIKSVKEIFDRQTSQRLQEYDKRLQDKRQKRKEQRDKNIQQIIEKDKMEKSLAEKVEKGCLMCGCGLGGVAASVGLFGGLGIYGWKNAVLANATQKGIDAGIAKAITEVISKFGLKELNGVALGKSITSSNFNKHMFYIDAVQGRYNNIACPADPVSDNGVLCFYKTSLDNDTRVTQSIVANVQKVVEEANKEVTIVTKTEISAIEASSTYLYSAIGYSVLAILIIVLVMIIIYLVLRYRRKKKMNKKSQYTKLLNQ